MYTKLTGDGPTSAIASASVEDVIISIVPDSCLMRP